MPFCFLFAFGMVFSRPLHVATLGLLLPAALGCGFFGKHHHVVRPCSASHGPPPKLYRFPPCPQHCSEHRPLCLWALCTRPSLGFVPRSRAVGHGVHTCGSAQVLPAGPRGSRVPTFFPDLSFIRLSRSCLHHRYKVVSRCAEQL